MQEPEEGSDGAINDGLVNLAFTGVVSVEGGAEAMEDGHIGGVGLGGRVILVGEGLEKSCR